MLNNLNVHNKYIRYVTNQVSKKLKIVTIPFSDHIMWYVWDWYPSVSYPQESWIRPKCLVGL